jgi:hypothetical protein
VVLLILAAIWAVVLIPPWVRSRREVKPARSMVSFQRRLSSLERAMPYGYAYADDMYLDASSPDGLGPGAGDDDPAGGARADLHRDHPDDAEATAPAVVEFTNLAGSRGASGSVARLQPREAELGTERLSAAGRASSRVALHRRRQIFFLLLVSVVASLGVAAALNAVTTWAVHATFSLLFLSYVFLLVRHHQRALDRAAKVHYLTPVRAHRPAVVVLHGTAR